jgi:glycosyltransferase involved in cell wall biosynthesis
MQTVRVIPNGVDEVLFRPIEKSWARDILGLPRDGIQALFIAAGGGSDPNKGFDLFCEAIAVMGARGAGSNVLPVFAGAPKLPADVPAECGSFMVLGSISDERVLGLAYSAADITVVPSRQENLANTVLESLACGTPVAAFDIGGMPDMVEDGINGVLAKPYSAEHLASRMEWCLSDGERLKRMRDAARRTILDEFTLMRQARRYRELYEELAADQPGRGST